MCVCVCCQHLYTVLFQCFKLSCVAFPCLLRCCHCSVLLWKVLKGIDSWLHPYIARNIKYCFYNTLQLKLYLLCNILHLFSVLVLFQVHIFHVINVENSIIELFLLSKSSDLIKRQLLSDRECFCPHIHQWHTSCISVLIYDQR